MTINGSNDADDFDEYDDYFETPKTIVEPKLRSSTKAGIFGVITGAILYWLPIVEHVIPPDIKVWAVPLVMYVVTRFTRSPINPGKL